MAKVYEVTVKIGVYVDSQAAALELIERRLLHPEGRSRDPQDVQVIETLNIKAAKG